MRQNWTVPLAGGADQMGYVRCMMARKLWQWRRGWVMALGLLIIMGGGVWLAAAHAFDIDEFDVHIPMPAQEEVTFTFTPTQPGTYTFYCGLLGHRGGGMVGTLIVE